MGRIPAVVGKTTAIFSVGLPGGTSVPQPIQRSQKLCAENLVYWIGSKIGIVGIAKMARSHSASPWSSKQGLDSRNVSMRSPIDERVRRILIN